MTRPFNDVRPGGQLSAAELNRAFDQLDRISDFGGGGSSGIGATDEFGQVAFYDESRPTTKMRILSGSNPFAWEEVFQSAPGVWSATGNRSGTTTNNPAVELTGNAGVAAGDVVDGQFEILPDGSTRWTFTRPTSGLTSLVKNTSAPAETAGPVTDAAVQVFSATGITLGVDGDGKKGLMLKEWIYVSKSADYTGSVNEHVSYDISGGNATYTFPPSPAVGDKVRVGLVTDGGSNHLSLDGNGNNVEGGVRSLSNANCYFAWREFRFLGGTAGWCSNSPIT